MGHFETPWFHWPPMIGVVTTLGTAVPASEAGFDQSRLPTGVSTLSVFIAPMTLDLSVCAPLAVSTGAARSNSDWLAPNCWLHCLPVAGSYPSPQSLLDFTH